ncbi:arrestin domain-containing protein 3-like [Mizuhopecten yessoensis]|uniref:Arrestin domain-containing protein 3 n=1 Tax=Mizuhopecten yessoensis TaxID=6573 RepID=A0A210Q6U2_MIZYE|nr:arrestin domain-containing protein 3-like [Mizuhopecten yessoensis]XP_021365635.1 arrestin domain-containing protein 3-like [Mizuhopecten yessoensis]XP_021365636.1 arrestin domain-containing protein 3-like [Mizuhopecten yessoensis]XP_021365637.1 arrestin domain-containing protein 3-like [Mizuhopecten yessoensis]XP_021365638.1 arrestin domain-containing protein 3-like [Mizuhopecten yessoensis]OWF44458.1 Arrestin domain-containing protein 3 [Mizuhopecten yessoensis]
MGVKNLDIRVNGGQSVFYPGQMVQGNIHLDVDSDTKVKEIRLRFRGYADVHWTEQKSRGSGKHRRTYTKHYRSHETYFDNIVKVLVPGPGEDQLIMKPGQYTYPFGMQLPGKCATSFEGGVGRVRYYLQAIVDKPWAFDNEHFHPFTVIQLLDLNGRTDVMNTVENQGSKTLCCLCCESGPITGKLRLNRTGYVPGEKIMVQGEVVNHSRRAMKNHQINLLMNVNYHAGGKTRRVQTEVAELRKIEIPPGESDSWNGEGLVIPPLPASGLPGCSIITIDYTVELQVVPSGLAFDLSVPIPVIIGSIPLVSVVQQFGVPMNKPTTVHAPESRVNPSAPPPSYSDIYHNDPAYPPPPQSMMPENIPPPSYGRSALGAMSGGYSEGNEVDNEDAAPNSVQPTNQPSNQNWSPMYPYYDWNRPDANFHVKEKEQRA